MSKTRRATVRRLPERGRYDRATVESILDEAVVCHLGLVHEGSPVVLPTLFVRRGDDIYLHGSPASAMLRSMKRDAEVCLTVTIVDGLVLARSAFHHSVNYRCAVVFGAARAVEDPVEKAAAMDALVDKVVPGRSREARKPSEKELRATLVMALKLDEFSCKVRTGPPVDDDEDYELPVWAGVLPLHVVPGVPVTDPLCSAEGRRHEPFVEAGRWHAAATRG